MIKVGIIGTNFGSTLARAFMATPGAQVVGIAGNNFEQTKKLCEISLEQNGLFGIKPYSSWKELVSNPEIDLICIAAPNFLHKEMFSFALTHKKHILLEKPADISLDGVEDMIKMKKTVDKQNGSCCCFVDHEMRFNPKVNWIRNQIVSGQLGEITALWVSGLLNGFSDSKYELDWQRQKSKGGGQILLYGTHLMDLARYLTNHNRIIRGNMYKRVVPDEKHPGQATGESQFTGSYETENGIVISLFNNNHCQGYKDFEIQVFGTKGIVLYSDTKGLQVSYSNAQPLQSITVEDPLKNIVLGRSLVSGSVKYLAHEYTKLLNGEKVNMDYFCTLEQAYDNMKYLDIEAGGELIPKKGTAKENKISTLVFDLDGTAVPMEEKPLKEQTKPSTTLVKVLDKIKSYINVCVSTGRPWQNCNYLIRLLGINKPCIVAAGTQIRDPELGTILWEKKFSMVTAQKIQKIFCDYKYKLFVDDDLILRTPQEIKIDFKPRILYLMDISRWDTGEILSRLLHIQETYSYAVPGYNEGRFDIFVIHKEATKKNALAKVQKMIGTTPDHTMVVSDSYGDVPMFDLARIRIAMGNANIKLKDRADFVTKSVFEDGLTNAIEKFILKK